MHHIFMDRLAILSSRLPESHVAGVLTLQTPHYQSVLQRLSPDMKLTPHESPSVGVQDTEYLLETAKEKITLRFAEPPRILRTGMVLGVVGCKQDSGFQVDDWCFPSLKTVPYPVTSSRICVLAWSNHTQLQSLASLLRADDHLVLFGYIQDDTLAELSTLVTMVWVLPVTYEHYSNPHLPQQPMHACLFRKSLATQRVRLVTNPFCWQGLLFCTIPEPDIALQSSLLVSDPRDKPGIGPLGKHTDLILESRPGHVFCRWLNGNQTGDTITMIQDQQIYVWSNNQVSAFIF
jgi:hypothetical protein